MFTHIARGYDGFDHLASVGNDFVWRPRALWDLDRFRAPGPVRRVLDLGCGTGDLAVLVARHFPEAEVIGLDFTRAMLDKATVRHRAARERRRIDFGRGTGLRLPFLDGAFDLVTNAFVLRNFADLPLALAEARRVLRPDGVLLSLEITEPTSPTFRRIFHAYFDRFVPWLGAAVGSAGPYRYLPESLRSLPSRARLVEAMRSAGFARVEVRPQSLGIVATFLAESGATPAHGSQCR
ncbi:MAG: ubiquinone/menaquinone biosynthesis methyltransferase, partial [Thermoplasmata archaeon]|jgi:demethylmenaquinone methyltransferase/2-methoxy-6-polyprenyl-1,4-benzoquinol methylase